MINIRRLGRVFDEAMLRAGLWNSCCKGAILPAPRGLARDKNEKSKRSCPPLALVSISYFGEEECEPTENVPVPGHEGLGE